MRVLAALVVCALALGVGFAVTAFPGTAGVSLAAKCGKERWKVKTLTDPAKDKVKLTAKMTTIEKLRKMKVPPGLNQNSDRFIPQETVTYQVNALLMSVKAEADEDLHLVVADPRVGGSMIVEFPSGNCIGTKARAQMIAARQALKDACGEVPKKVGALWTLSGKATIAGVAFFDVIHGQGGVAQNGVELHPVIEFASTDCTVVRK